MDIATARFLISTKGRSLLDRVRETRDLVPHRRVKAHLDDGTTVQVRAALGQDDLRRRAAARIPVAERLLFTEEALEQATAWAVAEDRAAAWRPSVEGPLTDLGAGIGIDTLAFAAAGRDVVAYERDPVRALLLGHNADALGLLDRIEIREEDVLEAKPSGPEAFLDPARRSGGRRTRDPDRFEPPRSTWAGLLEPFEAALVKLAPGDPTGEGDAPEAMLPFEVVSLDGRLRETRQYRGDVGDRPGRAARCVSSGAWIGGPGVSWPPARAPREGDLLLDVDPAVTVAGLVGDLCRHLDAAPIHPRIAYLLGTKAPFPTLGRWVRVEAVLRPRARELKTWLRARDAGALTIRTRGVADSVETWRRRLGRRRGSNPTTLVFTRGPDDGWIALGGREVEAPFDRMTLE